MTHQGFHAFLWSFINVCFSRGLLVLLLLGISAGCSGKPGAGELTELMSRESPHPLAIGGRELTILSLEADGDQRWNVEIECEETPEEDWLLKLDPSAELQGEGSLKQKYEAALQTLQNLRAPESQKWIPHSQKLEQFTFPELFQLNCRKGEPVKWKATVLVDRSGKETQLTLPDLQLSDGTAVRDLIARSSLPSEAVLADGGPLDPLRQYRELQAEFVAGVAQASTEMEQRLLKEKQALEKLIQHSLPLSGKLFPAQSESEAVVFLHERGKTETSLNAVAIDQKDPLSRVVFRGDLSLPPVNSDASQKLRRVHDGWMLILNNEDPSLSRMARKVRENRILFYDPASNLYQLSDARRSETLQVATDSEMSQAFVGRSREQDIVDGAQYTGRESIVGQADRAVVMSITGYEAETGNMRVVIEDAQTPYTFAVFEGKLQLEAPHHLGIPIRLQQVTSYTHPSQRKPKSGVFSRNTRSELLLIPVEQGFQGQFADAEVMFERRSGESEVIAAEQRWQNTLVPGAAWRGVTKWRDEAVKQVTLRVAEVRDQGKYVRLTLARDDEPVQQVVYEGSLLNGNGMIDGYGLVMQQYGAATIYEHDYFGVFFSRWESEDKKVFRISPDGKKLYGVSSGGEMLTLERDASVESTDQLATKARKEVWQTVLTPGKIWEGTIRSLKHKQTAEVKMIVRGFELEGKQVTLELVPKVQQKAKVVFEGSLDTSDRGTNGFGLVLKKKQKVSGPGNVFGNWDTQLQFSLDATGKRLSGRTNDHGDVEYLDLRLLETK
ncbi:MAG: hypothetical protein NXI29_19595 [bacterium]|nr:hypothetical protein [bacterium]